MVEDNKGMLGIAVDYYKKLFSKEYCLDIDLCDDFWVSRRWSLRIIIKCLMLIFVKKKLKRLFLGLMLKGHLA
jgi:hypothetical protein